MSTGLINKAQKRGQSFLLIIRDQSHRERRIVGLQRNRRSHGAILAWPNRYFYEDIMRAHGDKDVTHLLLHSNVLQKKGFPLIFHGVKGKEKRTRHSPSCYNIIEASVVRDYCVRIIEDKELRICKCGASFGSAFLFYPSVDPEEIGIIAPYRAQVRIIRTLLRQVNLSEISVGSVEQFQGQVGFYRIYTMSDANSGLL